RDHRGREAHATAAVHGHPFARPRAALGDNGAVRRGEAAPQQRGGREGHGIGEAHQVHVGIRKSNELRERAPAGEARLVVVIAALLVARATALTGAASHREGDGDAVARFPFAYVPARRDHSTGELVSRNVRYFHVGVVAFPTVPVRAAQAGGSHFYNDAIGRGRGIGDVDQTQRTAEFFVANCFHWRPV